MKHPTRPLILFVSMITSLSALAADAIKPVDDVVKPAVPDRQRCVVPDRVRLTGYVGARIDASERNRLLTIDENEQLDGFRNRPGKQAWVGEHVGKYLHAATLAWVYSGDAMLREKIDRVATELIKCQEPDGYLGTYVDRWPAHRGWDVWVHKYDLIGLLTYYRFTGDA